MESKYFRVSARLETAPRWWTFARRSWPDHIAGARPLLDGEPVVLPADAAEALRAWAVGVAGWPKSGAFPIQFAAAGFVSPTGQERARWAIKIWVTPAERARIEYVAASYSKSVGGLLRDAFLERDAADGEWEEE